MIDLKKPIECDGRKIDVIYIEPYIYPVDENDPRWWNLDGSAIGIWARLTNVPPDQKQEGERYPMGRDQPAKIDCRVKDCKYYAGGGECTNVSPAITLNESGKFVCWSYGQRVTRENALEKMVVELVAIFEQQSKPYPEDVTDVLNRAKNLLNEQR